MSTAYLRVGGLALLGTLLACPRNESQLRPAPRRDARAADAAPAPPPTQPVVVPRDVPAPAREPSGARDTMMPLTTGAERFVALATQVDGGAPSELQRELEVLRMSVRPMVAPPVRLASLRLLHALGALAQPWLRGGAPPSAGLLAARRQAVTQAKAQLDQAVAANPGVRETPHNSAEAAAVALQAWLVASRASGAGGGFVEPQVRWFGGLPAGLDGGLAEACAARLRHQPTAPVAGEFSPAGGCALVSFGTSNAADAALARVVAAPGAAGVTLAVAAWDGGTFRLSGGPE